MGVDSSMLHQISSPMQGCASLPREVSPFFSFLFRASRKPFSCDHGAWELLCLYFTPHDEQLRCIL